jgi:thiamine pyrophosphate-dependent acetolactate synthase large subunit-like protein
MGWRQSSGRSVRVDDPQKLGAAWDEVLNADRPAVLEVITDPNIPLLPPFRQTRPRAARRLRRK